MSCNLGRDVANRIYHVIGRHAALNVRHAVAKPEWAVHRGWSKQGWRASYTPTPVLEFAWRNETQEQQREIVVGEQRWLLHMHISVLDGPWAAQRCKTRRGRLMVGDP